MPMILDESFYVHDAITVAKALLGATIHIHGKSLLLTETEAYLNEEDKAAHSRFGRTKRSSILYGSPGVLYVFMIYGMYYCANVVVNKKDYPSAVLFRNGRTKEGENIKGPGRFSRYLCITKEDNGKSFLNNSGIYIEKTRDIPESQIHAGSRIGVAYAKEWAEKPLRFWID